MFSSKDAVLFGSIVMISGEQRGLTAWIYPTLADHTELSVDPVSEGLLGEDYLLNEVTSHLVFLRVEESPVFLVYAASWSTYVQHERLHRAVYVL